jgi:hypothetical protein
MILNIIFIQKSGGLFWREHFCVDDTGGWAQNH